MRVWALGEGEREGIDEISLAFLLFCPGGRQACRFVDEGQGQTTDTV